MRRLWKVIRILVVLLVVLIVAGVVALNVIDPNQFKDTIAERAKAATGRDLAITGDIDLSVGLTTRVSLAGVTLSNPEWAAAAQMVDVQRFEAEVAVLPLIFGNIEVNRLVLSGATINVERNAQGQASWEFGEPGAGDDTGPSADRGGDDDDGGESDGFEIPVVRDVLIENVSVNFSDATTGQTQQFTLARLALQGDGPDAPLTLDLSAVWNELDIIADGQVGALADAGGNPLPVNFTAQALGFDVGIDGTVTAKDQVVDLALTVAAADLSGLAAIAGDAPLPTAAPLNLSANISGGAERISLSDLALAFGATDLAGEITVDRSGGRPSVTGNLTSTMIDLTELTPPAAAEGGAAPDPAPAEGAAASSAPEGKVFPNDPLPLDGLRAADADISIAVAQLITPTALSLEDIQINIGLADGALSIDPLSALIAGTALDGVISLAENAGVADLNIDIAAPTLDIGRLVQEAAGLEILRGSGALDIELTSSGASVAEIMAGLNGHTTMLMNEGQMKTEGFDLIIGGLSSVVGSLFGEQSEWTVLSCLATNLEFTDGVAATALLIDTDVAVISGAGQLDFAQEVPELTITPNAKSATLNLALPIKVGGTFADPSFKPDELAAASTIGALLGSTLFPPAALLAFGDLGSGDTACVADAQEAVESSESSSPVEAVTDTVGDVLEGGAEGVGDAVEGIGRGIRGLLGGGN